MAADSIPLVLHRGVGPLSQRFCLYHPPLGREVKGLVVHAHAFAEEMNKSRRMCALQARAFAASGFATLQLDLLGCGDSAGDFGDATWHDWLDDISWGIDVLRKRVAADGATQGDLPLWLWGHRAGALLAVEQARRMGPHATPNLLLWAPVLQGRTALQQFLRLKMASGLLGSQADMANDRSGGGVKALRERLASGQPVDVAGYRVGAALAAGMDQATLAAPAGPGRLVWLDVAPAASDGPTPAALSSAQAWREGGWAVCQAVVNGPAFWQTTEIQDCPSLLRASLQAVHRREDRLIDAHSAAAAA